MADRDGAARPHPRAVNRAVRDRGEHALDYRAVRWSSVGLVENRDAAHQAGRFLTPSRAFGRGGRRRWGYCNLLADLRPTTLVQHL